MTSSTRLNPRTGDEGNWKVMRDTVAAPSKPGNYGVGLGLANGFVGLKTYLPVLSI
jgi:hypothetical protein